MLPKDTKAGRVSNFIFARADRIPVSIFDLYHGHHRAHPLKLLILFEGSVHRAPLFG